MTNQLQPTEQKKALAVITYARFDYFELVLPSILSQTIKSRPLSEHYDIFVFQDGLCEKETDFNYIGHKKISQVLGLLPHGIKVLGRK